MQKNATCEMPSARKDDCIFLNREIHIPITIIENANY